MFFNSYSISSDVIFFNSFFSYFECDTIIVIRWQEWVALPRVPLPVEKGEWDVLEAEQIYRQNNSKITKLMVVATPSGKGKRKSERQGWFSCLYSHERSWWWQWLCSFLQHCCSVDEHNDDDYVRFLSAVVPLTTLTMTMFIFITLNDDEYVC